MTTNVRSTFNWVRCGITPAPSFLYGTKIYTAC
nr:MAG TPA: hypothetical protein [Caudoviricetes sp.]